MFEPLGAVIRLHREAQGLTINQLAKLAGVSRTRLITLEQGNDNIPTELLVKITNALKITELRIGGMATPAAPLNPDVASVAAEAFQLAQKIIDGALASADDVDRVGGRAEELFGGGDQARMTGNA